MLGRIGGVDFHFPRQKRLDVDLSGGGDGQPERKALKTHESVLFPFGKQFFGGCRVFLTLDDVDVPEGEEILRRLE